MNSKVVILFSKCLKKYMDMNVQPAHDVHDLYSKGESTL